MSQITFEIPPDLEARLQQEAERRQTTVAALAREALENLVGTGDRRRRLGARAAGRSGQTDVSERIEEILREEWGR